MKLSKFWKIVIGIATAIIAALPIFFFFTWMGFMIFAVSSSNGPQSKTPDVFVFLFIFLVISQILWNFLRLTMLAFYQSHAILNERGSKFFRILLSLGNFFLPYITMPIYYFIFIFPENIPDWALEEPPSVVEDIAVSKPKAKKPRAKKKNTKEIEK